MSIQVTDGHRVFELNRQQSIDLELKLNVTFYGHTWRTIGDHLYDFGVAKLNSQKDLVVDPNQYDFLTMLKAKNGYQECRDLK